MRMSFGLSSTCHPGGNQVDGLPPVGNTDAGGIRLRSERIFGKTATLKSILRVVLSFEYKMCNTQHTQNIFDFD